MLSLQKDAVLDKNNPIIIEFDIEASIELESLNVEIWPKQITPHTGPVSNFSPSIIRPTQKFYHFREVVDLSSYPSGSVFHLKIVAPLRREHNHNLVFLKSIRFTIN